LEKDIVEKSKIPELEGKEVNLKQVDKKWREEYGITKARLYFGDEYTKNTVVFKDGEFIAVVGDYHSIYPNELAKELGDSVAEEMGFRQKEVHRSDGKLYAIYLDSTPLDIGKEDPVKRGFVIANSIDGTMSLRAEGFTYRKKCENGVFLGKKHVVSMSRKHTPGLEIDPSRVKSNVDKALEQVELVMKSYEEMAKQRTNQKIAEALADSQLPRKLLPDHFCFSEDNTLEDWNVDTKQWQLYNDVTEKIWHNDETNMDSKRSYFKKLHRAMRVPRENVK